MSNKLTPVTPTISAIKLPDGAVTTIYKDHLSMITETKRSVSTPMRDVDVAVTKNFSRIDLPPGKWRILGPVSELTPEQKERITPMVYDGTDDEAVGNITIYECFDGSDLCCDNVESSFQSLLQSKGVYTENPYGKKTPTSPGPFPSLAIHKAKHSESQQYVGNWILIEKEVEK